MTFRVEWQVIGEESLRGPLYMNAHTAEGAITRWEDEYELADDEVDRVTYACATSMQTCATSTSTVLFADRLYRVDV